MGGNCLNFPLFKGINGWVRECNMLDLGAVGPKFTWRNCRIGKALIQQHLDKAYCNILWRGLFLEAFVRNLPRTKSDHHPILIVLDSQQKV